MSAALAVPALLALAWLFLAAPRLPVRRRAFAGLAAWDYAHRGLHDNRAGCPENSLPAFAAAVAAGYGIELDVQLTRDGEMVVFHDDTLERACGVKGLLRERTLAQLGELRLFGTDARIPTFDEALRVVDGRVPLIVELKSLSDIPRGTAAIAARLDGYAGRYCVESFDPRIMRWYKKHRPHVLRGQLAGTENGRRTSRHDWLLWSMAGNALSRPDFIAYGHAGTRHVPFRAVRALFHPVAVAWTVRAPQDYPVRKKQYDMLIFEGFSPNELKEEHTP